MGRTVGAADGRREVLGFDVGDSEDGAFWTAFLRSLKSRGLSGVQLVISDAHSGLRAAIEAILIGAAWQRCRVHFLRNLLAQVPKGSAEMVAAAIRTIFALPDARRVPAAAMTAAAVVLLPPKHDASEVSPKSLHNGSVFGAIRGDAHRLVRHEMAPVVLRQ